MTRGLLHRAAITSFVTTVVLVALVRCTGSTDPDSGDACHPGDRLQCTCASGALGLTTCSSGTFGPCDCAVTLPANFGKYLGPCHTTSDCPPGDICFMFGTKGLACTHTCEASIECAAPSPKCNPRSVCAPPD
jgi:hypothetical protein